MGTKYNRADGDRIRFKITPYVTVSKIVNYGLSTLPITPFNYLPSSSTLSQKVNDLKDVSEYLRAKLRQIHNYHTVPLFSLIIHSPLLLSLHSTEITEVSEANRKSIHIHFTYLSTVLTFNTLTLTRQLSQYKLSV